MDDPHTCRVESVIYEHATHFVFPESMLKTMLPIGSGIFMKLAFQAARKYPKECQSARMDIDQRVRNAVMQTYIHGNFPVFEGFNHMQYQIQNPEGFARMLKKIIETDRLPELVF